MRVETRLEQGLQLGFVTQLVEYQTFNLRVVGSIPTEPTKGDMMTKAELKTLQKTLKAINGNEVKDAVQHMIKFLHEHGHAVAIFTPEEMADTTATDEEIEESMITAGFMTMDCFKINKEDEDE